MAHTTRMLRMHSLAVSCKCLLCRSRSVELSTVAVGPWEPLAPLGPVLARDEAKRTVPSIDPHTKFIAGVCVGESTVSSV